MAYKDNVQPRMEGLVQQQNKRTSRDCTCLSAYREYREYSVAAAVNAAETSGLRLLGNFRSAHACASMCALGCAQYSGRRSLTIATVLSVRSTRTVMSDGGSGASGSARRKNGSEYLQYSQYLQVWTSQYSQYSQYPQYSQRPHRSAGAVRAVQGHSRRNGCTKQ